MTRAIASWSWVILACIFISPAVSIVAWIGLLLLAYAAFEAIPTVPGGGGGPALNIVYVTINFWPYVLIGVVMLVIWRHLTDVEDQPEKAQHETFPSAVQKFRYQFDWIGILGGLLVSPALLIPFHFGVVKLAKVVSINLQTILSLPQLNEFFGPTMLIGLLVLSAYVAGFLGARIRDLK